MVVVAKRFKRAKEGEKQKEKRVPKRQWDVHKDVGTRGWRRECYSNIPKQTYRLLFSCNNTVCMTRHHRMCTNTYKINFAERTSNAVREISQSIQFRQCGNVIKKNGQQRDEKVVMFCLGHKPQASIRITTITITTSPTIIIPSTTTGRFAILKCLIRALLWFRG